MTGQAFTTSINGNLNITLAVAAAIVFGAAGWLIGRYANRARAIRTTQDALERAGRDVRMFRVNQKGAAIGPYADRALQEAEQIIMYRSLRGNYANRPTGESRMRHPDVPRILDRDRQQAIIGRVLQTAPVLRPRPPLPALVPAGMANGPDDTYAGHRANAVHKRYSPSSHKLVAAAARGRRRRESER